MRDQRTRADLDRAAHVATYREALARSRSGIRVLEGGSGTGRSTVRFAMDAEVEAIGLDESPVAIQAGTELAASVALKGTARFVEGDLYALPFDDQSFDIYFSDSVFEHLERPDVALREAGRVVRAGGFVVIGVPNKWRPDGWDLYRRLSSLPYRQDSWSPPGLRRLFLDVGLTPERLYGDEIWLERNISLLRARFGRRAPDRQDPAPDVVVAGDGPTVGRARSLGKRIVSTALPQRLHVNIGIVARRPGM